MDLVFEVARIVAPIFVLTAIGYGWVRIGWPYDVAFVTRLSMTIAIPCLIFMALIRSDVDPALLRNTVLAASLAYALVGVLIFVLIHALNLDTATYWAPLTFGNTGNLGLPLALFAFGDVGLGYAVVVFAVMAILSFTIGIWMVAGAGSFGKVASEPLVWATLLGALFLWQGWQTPAFLTNAIALTGQMAIPMMLITLGVAIARLETSAMTRAVVLSVVKLAICVAAGWATGVWFGLDPIAAAVLIVQVATPVAVTSYLIAEKYGADAEPVAGLVVASTLLSVIALPVILAFVI